ncbi:MAG: NAD(P)/FAD-dependent oxidoreductase, partial [Dehalococcoidales bacterium]|nr:NAD(P)/FAD-dependent oxidoreductase [Dehalococcoidales bacterium]
DVAVLERKTSLGGPVCCTGIISQECIDSFGIDNSIIVRRINSARLFSPTGSLLAVSRPQNQACVVDRGALDALFARRAQNKGVQYFLGSKVNEVRVESDRLKITAVQQDGTVMFEARAVIIATGFGSKLPVRLGLGNVSDYVIGVQTQVEAVGLDETEIYLGRQVAPGFFAWMVPTSPSRALVGLLARRNPGIHVKRLLASLLSENRIVSDDTVVKCRGISLKPLPRTYGDRLLVVGDAAGQVKPTTGGGIYYGLLCAEIAANRLNSALERDELTAKDLVGYQREWRARLGRELRIGYYARRVFEALSDRQIDRIFDIARSNNIEEILMNSPGLSFDWHGEILLTLLRRKILSGPLAAMAVALNRVR